MSKKKRRKSGRRSASEIAQHYAYMFVLSRPFGFLKERKDDVINAVYFGILADRRERRKVKR